MTAINIFQTDLRHRGFEQINRCYRHIKQSHKNSIFMESRAVLLTVEKLNHNLGFKLLVRLKQFYGFSFSTNKYVQRENHDEKFKLTKTLLQQKKYLRYKQYAHQLQNRICVQFPHFHVPLFSRPISTSPLFAFPPFPQYHFHPLLLTHSHYSQFPTFSLLLGSRFPMSPVSQFPISDFLVSLQN